MRLAIVAALAVSPQLSFNELKSMLGLTDGNLSAHSRTLEEAGYIVVEKSFHGRRPYTAMRLTPKGRRAFERYLKTLRQIVDRGGQGHGRFFVSTGLELLFFWPVTFVSQSTLQELHHETLVPSAWIESCAARRRAPPRCGANGLDVPVGGLSLVILLLALLYGVCMGLFRRLPGRGSLVPAVVVHAR